MVKLLILLPIALTVRGAREGASKVEALAGLGDVTLGRCRVLCVRSRTV